MCNALHNKISYCLIFVFFYIGRISHDASFVSAEVDGDGDGHGHGHGNHGYVISGYWPDYRSYIDIERSISSSSSSIMTDLVLFSVEPREDGIISVRGKRTSSKNDDDDDHDAGGDGDGMCCLGEEILDKAQEAAAARKKGNNNHSSVNIWVSVGGAGRSQAFATIAKNENVRKKFVHQLKSLCLEENLKGVDFDWEQPANRDEYISYMQLLIDASNVFRKEGLLISLALHPRQTLPTKMYDYVDRIHLMTYDMVEPKEVPVGGGTYEYAYHASFENTVRAVHSLISSGCKPEKIIVGLPAYGRHEKNPSLVKTYSEVMEQSFQQQSRAPKGEYSDSHPNEERTKSIHIQDLESLDGYAVESKSMVKRKIRYVVEKKLGGIFLWEIGQDYRSDEYPSGLLLHHCSNAFIDELSLRRDMMVDDEL